MHISLYYWLKADLYILSIFVLLWQPNFCISVNVKKLITQNEVYVIMHFLFDYNQIQHLYYFIYCIRIANLRKFITLNLECIIMHFFLDYKQIEHCNDLLIKSLFDIILINYVDNN